jgi:DNA polymerase-3 subunit epsilon
VRTALASVPVDPEVLADVLGRQRDYRVLRRMRTMDRSETHGLSAGVLRGVCVDVETTGLDPFRDSIIELAVQSFVADAEGRIVATGEAHGWLEDPGVPLTDEITRVTRLKDDDLRGRSIPDGEAYAALAEADVVIAHNARFDCPFVERRIPELVGRPWACSLNGVDWAAAGFEGRTLSQLCGQIGWFYEAHRAGVDVTALLHLLDHELADGTTVLKRLIERERRPTWLFEAIDAPFDAKDALKERGYRWNGDRLLWWKEVAEDQRDAELDWATIRVYRAMRSPETTLIDWTARYARA